MALLKGLSIFLLLVGSVSGSDLDTEVMGPNTDGLGDFAPSLRRPMRKLGKDNKDGGKKPAPAPGGGGGNGSVPVSTSQNGGSNGGNTAPVLTPQNGGSNGGNPAPVTTSQNGGSNVVNLTPVMTSQNGGTNGGNTAPAPVLTPKNYFLGLTWDKLWDAATGGNTVGGCAIAIAASDSDCCFCDMYVKSATTGAAGYDGWPRNKDDQGTGCVKAPDFPRGVTICWYEFDEYDLAAPLIASYCTDNGKANAIAQLRDAIRYDQCNLTASRD